MRNWLVGLALTVATVPGWAQDWPTRPMTLIVPFAAGGPVDVAARVVAPRISEILGQQIIIENIGGAGGMTGSNRVAKAPGDGYLFVMGTTGTHASNQILYKKPMYVMSEFAPVTLVLENTKVLLVRKTLDVARLPDFVSYVKANHAKMQFGSAGTGSATHLGCLLFNAKLGVEVTHVPYRSSGQAMQDLVAGRIDYVCEVISTALPHIQSDSVRALALLSPSRSQVLPELPTALEQGLADVDSDGWNSLFMPRSTPEPIIRKLADATSQALDTPAVRERLLGLGLKLPTPDRRGPEYLATLVQQEIDKWTGPIKAAGVSAD
jgi:tripartite-type tricarboxylate transporter receptor subunit TctC